VSHENLTHQDIAHELPRSQQVQIYDASQPSMTLHQIVKRAQITQTSAAGLHERVPTPATDRNLPAQELSGYEHVHYSKTAEQIFDLIFKGETQRDSEIPIAASCVHRNVHGQNIHSPTCGFATNYGGYERVHYSEAVEQMMPRGHPLAGYKPYYEQISGYERVQYSETAEQIFDLIANAEEREAIARSEISSSMHQNMASQNQNLHSPISEPALDQISGYERVRYSRAVEQMMSVEEISIEH
jgi:hypothetical protein